jgi:hypothetical protein
MPTAKRARKSRLKKAALPFYPEPESAQQLRELSARTRVPQQVYLREGLDYVLDKYKRAT